MSLAGNAVTHLSATALAAAIRQGELTSADVINAHIAVLQRTAWTNALAAARFEEARADAASADERIASGETSLLPLLGVPITIEELIAVAGVPHTGGIPHRRKYRATADAPAWRGYVRPVRSCSQWATRPVPTTGVESNSKLYGRTSNAYDPKRTSGGSSGGDGAMVARAVLRSRSARTWAVRSASQPSSTACSATCRRRDSSPSPVTSPCLPASSAARSILARSPVAQQRTSCPCCGS